MRIRHSHRGLRALLADRHGAVIVEFAFLAPIALVMTFGLIEAGRLYWTKQTLDEVAYATARCMSVNSDCDTAAHQKSYAITRAASYGIALTDDDVTIVPATTCKDEPGANSVAIEHDAGSPVKGLLPFFSGNLSASACFPVVG